MRQIVPLLGVNQNLQVSLSIDGRIVNLALSIFYNRIAGYWVMSINDVDANVMLIDSLPLVRGDWRATNLLGQYAYLGIGSVYLIKNTGDSSKDYPTEDNLATDFSLLWSDAEVIP